MLCHRCRGFMVEEHLADASICDLLADADCSGVATRCLNCGCVDDPVIRANRFRLLVATRSGSVRKFDCVCS